LVVLRVYVRDLFAFHEVGNQLRPSLPECAVASSHDWFREPQPRTVLATHSRLSWSFLSWHRGTARPCQMGQIRFKRQSIFDFASSRIGVWGTIAVPGSLCDVSSVFARNRHPYGRGGRM